MLTDSNKGITNNITNNHLNLPVQISMTSGTISYIYDATGVKQRKIVSTGTTTDYASNFVYENNTLQFFNQPEGYVEPNGTLSGAETWNYVYQYKDHLGNIRLSYKDVSLTSTQSIQIVEENNYYPFGLKHKGYNSNVISEHRWKYNGKELQNELDLNWYDLGARNLDHALGGFMNVDPRAEEYNFQSTYTFANNNPVLYIDINGEGVDDWVERKNGSIYWDNNATSQATTKAGETYRGTSYQREKVWTNVNVRGNSESGLMQESYNSNGKMTYKNLTLWVDKAFEERGVARFKDAESNPRIEEYLTHTQLKGADINDATSWCAGFANFTLETSGVDGTGSALALSFRGSWGQNLENPAYGSIATVSYGGGKGHVGIVAGKNPNGQILILGGNQGSAVRGGQNEVNISPDNPAKFKYHYPKGLTPYYNLPTLNITGKALNYESTR